MVPNALTRTSLLPSFVSEFFKPVNEWFDNGLPNQLSMPAVNIAENETSFDVSVAAPGMDKDDFKIDLDGDLLTISAEKEETNENKKYNRREYNYSSFSRSFTLPEEVKHDKIAAKYEGGILHIMLPKNEAVKAPIKTISVS